MARMHARKKGKSGSTKPAAKSKPPWVDKNPEEVEEKVVELYEEGKSPSKIGTILRDKYGVPSTKVVCDKKITEILEENDLKPELPEDLSNLLKKARNLKEHVEENKKDFDNRRGLELIESKIRRLQSYYKEKGVLSEDWYYKRDKIDELIKE